MSRPENVLSLCFLYIVPLSFPCSFLRLNSFGRTGERKGEAYCDDGTPWRRTGMGKSAAVCLRAAGYKKKRLHTHDKGRVGSVCWSRSLTYEAIDWLVKLPA